MEFHHVDVFADDPFTGNSVTVFINGESLTADQMLTITKEFRHFESVFLRATEDLYRWQARVFDLFEELDFAGHPLLGAAAALHWRLGGERSRLWTIDLPARTVTVRTVVDGEGIQARIDQGRPEYGQTVTGTALTPILTGLGLETADLVAGFDPAVVSTGLRYLILPVSAHALDRAKIIVGDFAECLAKVGAQFIYVLDPYRLEGRHWNNDGLIEDVATGSAAGAVGAYLARVGHVPMREPFTLRQGRHAGRPSSLCVAPQGSTGDDITRVLVSGTVSAVAGGSLQTLPRSAQ